MLPNEPEKKYVEADVEDVTITFSSGRERVFTLRPDKGDTLFPRGKGLYITHAGEEVSINADLVETVSRRRRKLRVAADEGDVRRFS